MRSEADFVLLPFDTQVSVGSLSWPSCSTSRSPSKPSTDTLRLELEPISFVSSSCFALSFVVVRLRRDLVLIPTLLFFCSAMIVVQTVLIVAMGRIVAKFGRYKWIIFAGPLVVALGW